jgi:tRNA G18 (ribose-2'-O)-methylase SpoU
VKTAEDWVNLREKDLRAEGLFVAEGRLLVERAISSGCRVLALFADSAAAAGARDLAGQDIPLSVCGADEMSRIAGFSFHRGMFAVARRPVLPEFSGAAVPKTIPSGILVLPAITDPGNLGTLLRSALAFGFDTVLLGPETGDPFNRKVLRASMGAALILQLFRAEAGALDALLSAGFSVLAAAMEKNALVSGENVVKMIETQTLALVLGNEFDGIPEVWRKKCTAAIRIPVSSAVDSLNVAVAGSILMRDLSLFPRP